MADIRLSADDIDVPVFYNIDTGVFDCRICGAATRMVTHTLTDCLLRLASALRGEEAR